MKKYQKYSAASGIVLFILAALLSVSLLSVAVDFGGIDPAKRSVFYSIGKMLTRVYGFTSVCIPIFLIVAGTQCFSAKWRIRNGVILLGSVVPFFTLDVIEHICRMIASSETDSVMMVKLGSTLLIGAMILAAEFLLLSILGDVLENSMNEAREFSNNEIPEPEESEEDQIFEDETESDGEETPDSESETETENETVPEKRDFSNDKLFLQQKELLKDLIEDKPKTETPAKTEATEKPAKAEPSSAEIFEKTLAPASSDQTIVDDATIVPEQEPEVVENEDFDESEMIQDSVEEDEILEDDDFAEVGENEPSPFDHIFDEPKDSNEDATVAEEASNPVVNQDLAYDEPVHAETFEPTESNKLTEVFQETSPEPILAEIEESDTEPEPIFEEASHSDINQNLAEEEPAESNKRTEVFQEISPDFEDSTEEPADDDPTFDSSKSFDDDDDLIAEMNRTFGGEPEIAESEEATEPNFENATTSQESAPIPENAVSFQESAPVAESEPEEFFVEEEQIPVNSEDFQSDADEMNDVQPVSLSADDYDYLSQDENPADSINIEDIAEDEPAEENEGPLSVDDIFDEMDSDAAENPVFKPQDAPTAHDSLYQNEDDLDDEDRSLSEVDGIDFDETEESEESENFDDEYEFDPAARPVVDANGNPYEADDEEEAELEDDEILEDGDDAFDGETISDDSDGDFEDDFESDDEIQSEIDEINDLDFDDDEVDAPDTVSPEEIAETQKKQAELAAKATEEEQKPMRKLSEYKIPVDLLEKFSNDEYWLIDDETKKAGEDLTRTLNEFGIEAEVTGIRKGPVVTMFELLPAPGVKLSKIVNLQDNIALSLAAKSVRIVAPIPGKHAVGIEIPNKDRAIVSFREIIEQPLSEFKKMAVPVILGKDISGQSQIIDIAKTPHLLIAGATGAGKSVCVNSIILSILYNRSPRDVKLIMVDPKVVELKLYNDIPHLLTPVVTEPKRALQVLQYCICEMERRYALLDGMGVRDIVSYNTRIRERNIATEKLPYIVVIIDEFADLMATSGKELETNVARLTAMSRAVGIHLVLATQRPSVNVITGLIKANIPSRIAFMVASRTDSNIIIDATGAEKLLGKGDMLYTSAVNPIPTRIQGTLVGDNEVERVVEYVKSFGGPDYIDDEIFIDDDEDDGDNEPGLFSDGEDPLYDQALQIVVQAGKASASYIQRRLKIGYNRAARLVEEMEERGIVGPANGSKPREVIHMP